MLKQLKILGLIIGAAMLLSGCSFFEDEDLVKPAKLATFTAKTHVKKDWENRNSDGTYDQFLKLTPAFVGNKIFTDSYRGIVKAVNQKTGGDIWTAKTNLPFTSGIGADSQFLFIGTGAGRVVALRQSNGSIVWQTPVSNEVLATPVTAQDKVIVKTVDGKLIALSAATGEKIWDYAGTSADFILRGSSLPKVTGNLVINGLANGELVALNLKTGAVEWKQTIAEPSGNSPVERMTDIDADPVVVGNIIYIATYQGQVATLTLHGKILWQKALSSYAGLTVGPQNIYAVDAEGHIWAFDKNSGNKLWEQEHLSNRNLSTPTIYGSTLVLGDAEGYVHWLSLSSGKFLARERADRSEILVQPIVHDGDLYVMTKAGRLIKYHM